MKINVQWLQFVVSLAMWQITLLSLTIPFTIFLLYYFFIYTGYQQEITQQQVETTQRLSRIHHYQKMLETPPSLESLIAQQADYHISLNNPSTPEQLQHLLITYHFIPETWENAPNSLYKLTFNLSYTRLLTLLEHLNQTGLLLISLNIIPIKTELLSVQITLMALKGLSLEQGGIS
ncbi:hypothetical protein KAH51_03820 [Proteus vulgaris]|uniref:hypothetical protein n=1 Tax=Proteus TaxID=583 RepID=UPI000D69EE8A|nr:MULTISPECIES: hypothetical protein [Proteus]MBQ0212586.1 hypothetical protein [Proteus vulgaris]